MIDFSTPFYLTPCTTPNHFRLHTDSPSPASLSFACKGDLLQYLHRTYPAPAPLTRLRFGYEYGGRYGEYYDLRIYPPYFDFTLGAEQIPAIIQRDRFCLIHPTDGRNHAGFSQHGIVARTKPGPSGLTYLYSNPRLIARRAARVKEAARAKIRNGDFDWSDLSSIASTFRYALDKAFEHGLISISGGHDIRPHRGGWHRRSRSASDACANSLSLLSQVEDAIPRFKNGLSLFRTALLDQNNPDIFDSISPYLPGMLRSSSQRTSSVARFLLRERRAFRRLIARATLRRQRRAAYQRRKDRLELVALARNPSLASV